jgi:ribonuclease PH
VLVKFGETHVLCTASVSEDVPPFLMGTGQGWLTAEYRLLPGSTPKRQPRELTRVSGRTAEIQRLIGRSLRSVIDFQALGPRTITIDADVLQADGGTRTAAITGGFVALYDAITWLQGEGLVSASPIVHQIAAVSVGIVESTILVDLCYQEDARASVDMNVVMTAAGEFIEIQGTAEQHPFSLQQLQELLQLATHSIEELLILQNQALQLCEANRC